MLFEIYRRSAIAAHQIEDRHPTLTPDFEAKVKARSAVIRGTRKAEERAATIKELDAKQAALTKTRKEALGEKVEEPPAPNPTMREAVAEVQAHRTEETVYFAPESKDVTKTR